MFELEKKFVYRVEEGDTITSICNTFNTSKESIIRNNDNIPLYVGECLEVMVNDFILHIVKPTETIVSVAELYGVTEKDIKDHNNLLTDKLYIGQIIKIYKH